MSRRWLAGLIGLLFTCTMVGPLVGPLTAQEKAANLPVKRVVMFSSGVGYFERQGEVEGDARLDLTFNVRDINDLLKSMVLQDLGGGRISTISYASKEPIDRTLRTFAIDLTSNPTLADLLSQVRGEQIEIDAPTKIVGTIVGVEKREVPAGRNQTVTVSFLNLLTEEGLRSVSLDGVGRIKLTNAKLDAELRKALAVLAGSKDADKKAVTLNFLGEGKRNVQVGYIQESPIWKTSYRLVLDDEKPPFLQGWAIVENTTEEDWDSVQLSLISGRPISFLMDLYQPLFVTRPVVQPELYSSLKPRTYDQDLAKADDEFRRAAAAAARTDFLEKANGRRSGGIVQDEKSFDKPAFARADAEAESQAANRGLLAAEARGIVDLSAMQNTQSVAQAVDVGEMFQYTIATPVKIARQQSAMLPIVNDSVQGEKVVIYNSEVHAKHPLNGLRLKNTTDLHLMQGPVTVFDDGSYAGDAKIQDLPPKSERLISYAMDLDTEVAPKTEGQPPQLTTATLVRGVLTITRRFTRDHEYTVKNGGQKAKKLLIELPIDNDWTLAEPKEPAEKTRDLYRFAVDAQPGKPTTLKVRQTRTANEQLAVSNLDDNTIGFYVSSPEISQKVKDALAEVIKRKASLAKATADVAELNRQIAVIFAEQGRVRENMTQVPKDSELFRKYLTKFGEQETQVEKLRSEVQAKLAEQTKAQAALNDYLQGLDLS